MILLVLSLYYLFYLDIPIIFICTQEIIARAQIIYVTGFFLTVSVDSILALAKHAAEERKTFIMNLSAPFLIQFFGDQMAATIPYTDFVFGNESEAAAYGEAKVSEEREGEGVVQ